MKFIKVPNRKGDKIYYHYDLGRSKGQRMATGIFVYAKPQDQIQKNHNKEALMILETKKSQMIIDVQSTGSIYIPQHKFKANFLDFFAEYVELNKKNDNRHLSCCFTMFKKFINKNFISSTEITENFCKRFREYLLSHLNGETPQNYFARFKWVIKAATKDRYFYENPAEDVSAITNPSVAIKENLEADEYLRLLSTPCNNEEVESAFIFSLYTALRWVDVKHLQWSDIKDGVHVTRIIQKKTGRPVVLTLHELSQKILERQRNKLKMSRSDSANVFELPTANGANKILDEWVKKAGINKHITWSCARLSFSILLQDERIDEATVACLLGHTTTAQVRKTYKRHRPKPHTQAINVLPDPSNRITTPECKEHVLSVNYIYNISKS